MQKILSSLVSSFIMFSMVLSMGTGLLPTVASAVDVCSPGAQTYVSAPGHTVDGNPAVATSFEHAAWVTSASLGSGSDWIWHEANVSNPTSDETDVFTRTINVPGIFGSANIQIAADNGYSINVNGGAVEINELADEFNYGALSSHPLTLNAGSNTLEITVKNFGQANGTAQNNPGGLLYKLVVENTCSDPEPETSDVTLCKKDDNGAFLEGWTLKLNDGLNLETGDYSGVTNSDGCVTFQDVPYGTHEVMEVMQEGWEHISGAFEDGEVIVDSPTETFTVVNKEEGDEEEDNLGSITVCKVVQDTNGDIIAGADTTTFTVPGITPNPATSQGAPAGQLPNSVFTTSLDLDTNVIPGGEGDDAECVTYDDLALGGYYYGEETVSVGSTWALPKYNDQNSVNVNSLSDFFTYSGELFDGNAGNDAARNQNADGHITLTEGRPDRTLVVLNKLTDACPQIPENQPSGTDCTPEEEGATITAVKIVCDAETDLPNWGAGNVKTQITSTTADEFLASHSPQCHKEDWEFAWSLNLTNPGDETTGAGGTGWTGFNDQTVTDVPAEERVWVREQFENGYIPFTGKNTDQTVSAELYCGSDVLHYDNWEFIDTKKGEAYHCVGFNVSTTPPLPACDANIELIQNGSFETPDVVAGNYGIFPSGTSGLDWLVSWVSGQITGTEGLEIQDHVAGDPAVGSGNQFAELDADHPVKISQNITTVPTQDYTLSFKYSARPGRDAADNTIQVKADGVVLGADLADDGSGDLNTVWGTHTRNFTATDASTTIEFNDTGTDTSYGGYIDSVSVKCVEDTPEEGNLPPVADAGPDQVITLPTDSVSLDGTNSTDSDGTITTYVWTFVSGPSVVDPADNASSSASGLLEGTYVFKLDVTDNDGASDPDGDTVSITVNTEEKSDNFGDEGGVTSGGIARSGEVRGEAIEICNFAIDTYMRKGYKNNTHQVQVMQSLLNKYVAANLGVDGAFGPMTEAAVKAFQVKYGDNILKPWNLTSPTGIFYKTTLVQAKNLECPVTILPIPKDLINWSQNPAQVPPPAAQ